MNAEIGRSPMLVWRRIESRAIPARLGWYRGFPLRYSESTRESCVEPAGYHNTLFPRLSAPRCARSPHPPRGL